MSSVEIDYVLVLPGAHMLTRPDIIYVTAPSLSAPTPPPPTEDAPPPPQDAPPPPPSAPPRPQAPSATLNRSQPKKAAQPPVQKPAPKAPAAAPAVTTLAHEPGKPTTYHPATPAHPTAALTDLARQHGNISATPPTPATTKTPTTTPTHLTPKPAGTVRPSARGLPVEPSRSSSPRAAGRQLQAAPPGWGVLHARSIELPAADIHPSIVVVDASSIRSSGYRPHAYSSQRSPLQLLYGFAPDRASLAAVRPGWGATKRGVHPAPFGYQDVIPVSASMIKQIASLPQEFFKELLDDPAGTALAFAARRSELVQREIKYARTAERVGTVAADVLASHTKAAKLLLEHWAREWAGDKIEELKRKAVTALEKSVLQAFAGEAGAEAGVELLSAAQSALAISVIAAEIHEAKAFERAFPRALRHPEGKHFFLTLDYAFKAVPTPVGPPATAIRPSGTPARASVTSPGDGLVFGERGVVRSPVRAQVVAAAPPAGFRVEADPQTFLYWYATRRRQTP
jgi:hypothetical protein